jgi:RNA polymerase-interacting CarD/CdnL/TRCF family regulator
MTEKQMKQHSNDDEKACGALFRKGDWVVHKRLGVGRITSLEEKPVQGERVDCFCIEGEDSSLWMPVESSDNGRIRPVASESEMKSVQRVLVRAPEPMESNHKSRISQIQDTLANEGLRQKAALLRDLTGRRRRKSLNETEYRAMSTLFTRITKEWSITFRISQKQAQEQINSILEKSLSKLDELKKNT